PQLPAQHPLKRNGIVGYLDGMSDTELVDRYLHPCDRAYTVPDVLDWMGETAMRVIDFVPALRYSAALLVADPWIIAEIGRMPLFERYAVAELWSFHLDRHSFFTVRDDNATQPLQPGPDVVPSIRNASHLARQLQNQSAFRFRIDQATYRVPLRPTPVHRRILEAVDGQRTLKQLSEDLQVSWARFLDVFLDLYTPLLGATYATLAKPVD
ncbi:MAG: hypothetical protein AAF211_31745, partial [Myxococcota bacterium]